MVHDILLLVHHSLHFYEITIVLGHTVGDMKAKLPYSKIVEYGITVSGLPDGKPLKHPSSYGKTTLKKILENREKIKIQGTYDYAVIRPVGSYAVTNRSSASHRGDERVCRMPGYERMHSV